jgi:hypothetical protein
MDWIHVAQERDMYVALLNMFIEPSGSIKCREFLDYLMNYLHPKEVCAPWSQ